MSVNDSKIKSYCLFPQSFSCLKLKYFWFGKILDMSLTSRSCKNDHITFNVGTPSLEARNIRLVNIQTLARNEFAKWRRYKYFNRKLKFLK